MRSDQELFELLSRDPERGLGAIMDRYTGLVITIVQSKLGVVGTREDIEECVSDVFLDLWQRRDTLDPGEGSIAAYLAVVAKRRAIDVYRRLSAHARHLPTDPLPDRDDPSDTRPDIPAEDDIAAELIAREDAAALIRAVRALGTPDSEIIIRKYYLGESARSIGRALHMNENTVNKRAGRALARLKESIGGAFHERTH